MSTLLSSFGKRGVNLDLLTKQVDIEDSTYLSKYFVVAEFNPVFTAGKNVVAFNGSPFLKAGAEIQVQCIDSNGNSLYLEYPKSKTQFSDVANFLVAIHVYNENYNGQGKLVLLGTTKKGEIVRWVSNITIDKTLNNVSKTRFYNKPTMEARPLLYPVIDSSIGASVTSQVVLTGSFYSYAVTPVKDTIQSKINPRKTDVDYRLFFNVPNSPLFGPQTYPTLSFNSQLDGQRIDVLTNAIQSPNSYTDKLDTISASFTVKKVIDSKTIQLSDAFFYAVGRDNIVTNINSGSFITSYKWVSYNTQSDAYQKYVDPISQTTTYGKESYAEIVYKNLKTFSGFVARHKVYRKSLVYPGDFSLVVDEPIGFKEVLIDPITHNKSYAPMGKFFNQWHINKYWFTSSNDLQLSHSVTPRIDSMRIAPSQTFDQLDGTKYVIVKTDSVDTVPNDATYVWYDSTQFNELQGLSYNSNFISLKAGSLYALSMNISIEKDSQNPNSKVSFYLTSSTPSISKEKTYVSSFGMKLGEVLCSEYVPIKQFAEKQTIYFTPLEDYYGTMVIVPFQCGITISDVSLGVYGDYGFSPDTLTTRVPFDIKVPGELFELKSELFDINSTLVYSDLKTVQTFDSAGASLFVFFNHGSNIDPSKISKLSGSLSISQSLFLPNLDACGGNTRLVGYNIPINSPPEDYDGQVCFTNISNISVIPTSIANPTNDYISVTTVQGLSDLNGKSIAVRYTFIGSDTGGRKITIDAAGNKISYS